MINYRSQNAFRIDDERESNNFPFPKSAFFLLKTILSGIRISFTLKTLNARYVGAQLNLSEKSWLRSEFLYCYIKL